RGQRQPFALGPTTIERVGNLDEDTRAVAEQRVRADRAAVVEVGENFQRLADDRVRFGTLDVGNEAHTAGVMLVARIVEALRRGILCQNIVPVFQPGPRPLRTACPTWVS